MRVYQLMLPGWRREKKQKERSMLQVFVGFIPWILYWSLSGSRLWSSAILSGLAAALGLVAFRYIRRRDIKTMEVVTLGYFAIHAILTLAIGSPFLKIYGPVANSLVLAGMAFGTLALKSPFTYQYAKEDWGKSYWNDPAFIRINEIITGVWGGIFSFNALLGALAVFVFSGQGASVTLWLTVIIPNIGVVAGIVFSARFPSYAARKSVAARLDAWDPYKWPAPKFNGRPAAETEHDVIVIGSGIGGLSAAALLAKRGLKVAVFEQHYLPGGYCTAWERRVRPTNSAPETKERWTYVFDAGVHDFSGLGERGGIRSLLRLLDIEDAIEWKRNEQEYFLGQTHFKIPQDADEFVRQLGERFPAEAENISKFFAEMLLIYREMYADMDKTGGAPRTPDNVDDFLTYPKRNPHAYKWMNRPFVEMLNEFLHDERVKDLLCALTGYLSDDPGSLSVGDMAPIFGYHFDGGYYPVGGSQALPNELVKVIEKYNGKVYLRTPVQRIIVEKDRAVGIELKDGQIHRAKAIISNADTHKTFLELVGREHLPAAFAGYIEGLKLSTTAFEVFLGLDIVPDLASITMLDEIGIMIPSKLDPSLAPAGHTSMSLLKLLPQAESGSWDRKAPGYLQRKREYADEMIACAEEIIPGLRQHITYRQEGSPASFARFAWTSGGCIYGPATGQQRLTVKTPLKNLYVAGSGMMGGGVEAVVIAGIHAANEIYKN
jgi:phytoene dehydrogenase-like protein/intracellular septation protein A